MTNPPQESPSALADVRVLDLSGQIGQYAGKLLADLGADVIRVEPPAGSPARVAPPFYHDDPTENQSLDFWYFNTNKRSVTLDLETADGQHLVRRLLATTDVLIESYSPADAARLLPSVDEERTLTPRLIHCSITGFGSWGPHAEFAATDLIGQAMGGVLTLAGYPDRAPTMLPGSQGYISASVQAAQGIMAALFIRDADTPGRERLGHGQRVEVSMQEALSMSQETAMMYWDMRREVRKRQGEARLLPGVGTYPCADGHIFLMVGVSGFGAPWSVLANWLDEAGMAGDLTTPEWLEFMERSDLRNQVAIFQDPQQMAEIMTKFAHVSEVVGAFLLTKSKQELYEEGQRRRLLIGPVNSARDLVENRHLQARGWYQQVRHPELDADITFPGPPYRHSETPWAIRRRPPLLGEHTVEVLREDLGLTTEQVEMLMAAGVV